MASSSKASAVAVEQATNARQHFPSLEIVCLVPPTNDAKAYRSRLSNKRSLIAHDSDRAP